MTLTYLDYRHKVNRARVLLLLERAQLLVRVLLPLVERAQLLLKVQLPVLPVV